MVNNYYVKKLLKKSFYNIAAIIKSSAFFKTFYGGIASILMFHRIISSHDRQRSSFNKALEVTPEYLENCINYLKKNDYTIVSLDDIYNMLLYKKKPANRMVAFTFDDGYVDNYTLALPVFKKYNVPFTIYITTCFPEGNALLWWYLLEDLILNNDHLNFQIHNMAFNFHCTTMPEKMRTFYEIRKNILNSVSRTDLLSRLKQIFDPYKIPLYRKTEELALTWQQIRRLSKEPGVVIGAHTLNHLVLSKLSASEAEDEISGSKKILEAKLDMEIRHFAYPFGDKSDAGMREFDIINKYDFRTATTARVGNIFSSHSNQLHCLPRIIIDGELNMGNMQFLDISMNVIPALKNRFQRISTT